MEFGGRSAGRLKPAPQWRVWFLAEFSRDTPESKLSRTIPYFEGRVGWGWDALGSRTSDEDYTPIVEQMKPNRPVDYFRKFYADTALFGGTAATKCGLDFFGVDHILFASDVPFEPAPGLYIRETIRCIEALQLSPGKEYQIYQGNAEKLLGLAVPANER